MAAEKPKNELVEQGEQVVKATKGRGGNANFPASLKGTKAEDVKRIGAHLLKWYNKPKAVTDEEIADRLREYFVETLESGEVLTVEAMCLALGYPRQTIWRWATGAEGSTPTRRYLIKKAKELLASFDAQMVSEGKINPVTYIFRAKNYFGMVDKQEYVLTPNNPLGESKDPAEIQKRIAGGVTED